MSLSTRLHTGAGTATGTLVFGRFAPRKLSQPLLSLTFLTAMIVSLFKLRLPLGDGHATMSMASVVDFAVLATVGADVAMTICRGGCDGAVHGQRAPPAAVVSHGVQRGGVVLSVRTAGLVGRARRQR